VIDFSDFLITNAERFVFVWSNTKVLENIFLST
jgi:hypothetical protein